MKLFKINLDYYSTLLLFKSNISLINHKNQIQHDTPCTPKLLDSFISYDRIEFIPRNVEL
jgi:hypothetical protein